jgi:hypothetical protein
MTGFPNSPKILKGGLVLFDSVTAQPMPNGIIALQYNPDTLTRTLQIQGATGEGADRSEALRLKGPPVETIKIEAEIDATDQLEKADKNATQLGIHPQLALLETLVYPASSRLEANNSMLQLGKREILPVESPLTVFVWSKERVVPVRITELSVTEEEFDVNLNPIRAKVSLGLRVLSVDDLGFMHKGGSLFLAYLKRKEVLAVSARRGSEAILGVKFGVQS